MTQEAGGTPSGADKFRIENSLPQEITLGKEIDLSGKVAIVTGASKGIGRAIALKLAYHGADIVFNSRETSASEAGEVQSLIGSFERRGIWVPGDINDQSVRERISEAAIDTFGRIDILVNNAGTTRDTLTVRMTEDNWDRVVDTNLKSTEFMMKAVLRQMMKQRSGQIINISSVAGQIGTPGQANYAASKAGIDAITRSVAREMAPYNIKANSLALGYVETDLTSNLTDKQKEELLNLTSTREPIKAEEVADLVAYIASGRLPSLTARVINLDGGSPV
jgi:3-oxoacyl-[acyl-carrier protein] reductase